MLARLIVNTSRRMIYAFAPAISHGLLMPLSSIASLIALNQATGLLSPLFGPLIDKWGYRIVMLIALSMLAISMLMVGIFPVYVVFIVGIILAGLGKTIYDPALYSYIGTQVPYQQRSMAVGVVEFSWAGSALIGLPLVGLLISRFNWSTPFWVIGGITICLLIGLAIVLPTSATPSESLTSRAAVWRNWQQLRHESLARAALLFALLMSLANDLVFVVYSTWLTTDFGLTIKALGFATTVIGLAELLGEMLTASIADRVGIQRALVGGVILSTLAYFGLPLVGQTLTSALIGLFCLFLVFEFTIVTSISFATEILPQARATMMSSLGAASGIGRVLGASIGGLIWATGQASGWGGMLTIGLSAALINGIALISLLWGLSKHSTRNLAT